MSEERLPVGEVLCVGGGIAGLSAAIALARHGAGVTVVERGDGAVGASIGFHYRPVYALEELGILAQVMERARVMRAGEPPFWAHVYRANGDSLPVNVPVPSDDWRLPVSTTIYRPVLAQIMIDTALELGVEVLLGHSYRSLEPVDAGVEVELTTGERRRFDLVVAADGISSELRARFFPDFAEPIYTGSMAFRMMFDNAPDDWQFGLYVANGTTVATSRVPERLFYLAVPSHMERRHLEQDEAREIVRGVLADYRPSKMFDEMDERLAGGVHVIVGAYEWIFVEPPWHRDRVVLAGDAAHATAPTIGAAGGMAVEDGVVLAQELAKTDDVDVALAAYAERRTARTKLVVQTSANLMHTHQQRRPPHEEAATRLQALQQLVEPY